MILTVKYFAWVRERIGTGEETVTFPASVETVADALAFLKARGGGYDAAFEREDVIRAAIDHAHAPHTASLHGAKELAFFPPVTGG
jgi:molybdopterin synthase sulfur carrier subunit